MKKALSFSASLAVVATIAAAAPTLRVENREFNGRPRDIVVMENDRVRVEVVPSDSGRIAVFQDKRQEESAFEWFDDCPYHYGCRWEGFPFEYTTDTSAPGEVSVTVTGGGKISVGGIKKVTGISIAAPLELSLERRMTLRGDSSRLDIEVRIKNVGDGVAPRFRYMLHGVWGKIAPQPFAFVLPLDAGTEFFDSKRASALFREAIENNLKHNMDHPFSRFVPDVPADKPRFEPGSWAALLTAAGPNYMQFDKSRTDFFQYWYGGDATWHWTCESQSKPVELAPGDATEYSFAFACDASDIVFDTPTLAYGAVEGPSEATPGDTLHFASTCTTARDTDETASITFFLDGQDGAQWLDAGATATVRNFSFGDLAADIVLPGDIGNGTYPWRAVTGDGRELAKGSCEVMSREEMAQRKAERAVEAVRKPLQDRIDKMNEESKRARRDWERWRDGSDFLAAIRDPGAWGSDDASFTIVRDATEVAGDWKRTESLRVKAFEPALPCSLGSGELARLVDSRLASIGDQRTLVRDVAVSADGGLVAAALVDVASKKSSIVCWGDNGRQRPVGRFSPKPTETDDAFGPNLRALSFDSQGRLWVATGVWGTTSKFVAGPDGQPSEQPCEGWKGAVKVYGPNGTLVASIPLLDAPTDIVPAVADGIPLMLVPYRNVSAYHGAMVREGVALLDAASCSRVGEVKAPAGSVAVAGATGGLWCSDIAGHVSLHSSRGKGVAQVNDGTAPAVEDAVLPESSPLPARLRAGADGTAYVVRPLRRAIDRISADGAAASSAASEVPDSIGVPITVIHSADAPVIVGTTGVAAQTAAP